MLSRIKAPSTSGTHTRQMVRSNRVSTLATDLGHMNVVLKWCLCMNCLVCMFTYTEEIFFFRAFFLRPLPFNNSRNRNLFVRKVCKSMLPCNHLYQACSGAGLYENPVGTSQLPGFRKICISLGLLEVEIGKTESWRNKYRGVDLNTTRFVPGGFTCTNPPPSCTWRKVMDGYNSKKLVYQNIISEFLVPSATLVRPIVQNMFDTHYSKPARFEALQHL